MKVKKISIKKGYERIWVRTKLWFKTRLRFSGRRLDKAEDLDSKRMTLIEREDLWCNFDWTGKRSFEKSRRWMQDKIWKKKQTTLRRQCRLRTKTMFESEDVDWKEGSAKRDGFSNQKNLIARTTSVKGVDLIEQKNLIHMPRLNEHLDRLLLWSLRSQKYIARACLLKIVERWRMFFKNKSLVHLHVQFLHRHVEGRRKARQPANPWCKYWPASQSHSCWLAGNQIADKSQMLTRIFSYRS